MRPFIIWLFIASSCFVAYAGAYHTYLNANPHRVLVVIEASDPMKADWPKVEKAIGVLAKRPYTQFALATEKDLIHSWSVHLNPERLKPAGERNLQSLVAAPHLPADSVHERLLISNAPPDKLQSLQNWTVITP